MKKLFLLLGWAVLALSAAQAQEVKLTISTGLENDELKARTEGNISNLLTEVNRAQSAGEELNFAAFTIDEEAQRQLKMLWSNTPFRCKESQHSNPAIETAAGYQVRNLPLEVNLSGDTANQQAIIDFDHSGRITSFYFSVSDELYAKVMRDGLQAEDLRRRQVILDYTEHLYTAYFQKDINFLESLFGEDAITITGKVTKSHPSDSNVMPEDKVIYNTMSKNEYLARLRMIFKTGKSVSATLSEMEIQPHPTKEKSYGLLLRIGYQAGHYGDDGYVFLLWDFSDEKHPEIKIRTWQPYWQDPEHKQKISKEDIFHIRNFDI